MNGELWGSAKRLAEAWQAAGYATAAALEEVERSGLLNEQANGLRHRVGNLEVHLVRDLKGVIIGVQVTTTTGPLRSEDLRKVSIGQLDAAERGIPSPAVVIDVPTGYRKPDAFYAKVAEAFRSEVAAGTRAPAKTIAERQGVKLSTVHRWIHEARRRGILADFRPRG